MAASQEHRGPDFTGIWVDPSGSAGLGHNRLSIIDLSAAGRGPMASADGSRWISFNGEVYNYLELRAELSDYPFRSETDTEVVLAAYERWGAACLDRFLGMFAFAIWDERERTLFAARDRFGVKPLHFAWLPEGGFAFASEIKALHAAGVSAAPDDVAWATYLASGLSDLGGRTFWRDVQALPPGHFLTLHDDLLDVQRWYDLAEATGGDLDHRDEQVVREEYRSLLEESVRLRFRSDVPVGINLSGGVDSATLLGLVQQVEGPASDVAAFTFITGDDAYDELPWVEQVLATTKHPSIACQLTAADVPDLALSVQVAEDEPFGGIPTLAYARVFEAAHDRGVKVLLDGQGLDEQWGGYDYYAALTDPAVPSGGALTGPVQGSAAPSSVGTGLVPGFRGLAAPLAAPTPFSDPLRDRQYADVRFAKIPRALRFNDRISMRSSCELREPFLDHRLFELALRQPSERKIKGGVHKVLLREIARRLLPETISHAPKRPVQTPQREWLRGPLSEWGRALIEVSLDVYSGAWLDRGEVEKEWERFVSGEGDSSFAVWQWINLGLWHEAVMAPRTALEATGGAWRNE